MGLGSLKCFKWYYYCQGQSVSKNGMHSFYSASLWHHSVSQKCLCLPVFQILTLQISLVIKNHIVLWLAKLMKPSFLLSYDWLPWHLTAITYWIFSHNWDFHKLHLHMDSVVSITGWAHTKDTVKVSSLSDHLFS